MKAKRESVSSYEQRRKDEDLRPTRSDSGPFNVDVSHCVFPEIPTMQPQCCHDQDQNSIEAVNQREWQAEGGVATLQAPGANLSTINRGLDLHSTKRKRIEIPNDRFELEFSFYDQGLIRSTTDPELRSFLTMKIPPQFQALLPKTNCSRCERNFGDNLRPKSRLNVGITASEIEAPCQCFETSSDVPTRRGDGEICIHGNEPPPKPNRAGSQTGVRRRRGLDLAKSIKQFTLRQQYYQWSAKINSFYAKKGRETRLAEKQPTTATARRKSRILALRSRSKKQTGDEGDMMISERLLLYFRLLSSLDTQSLFSSLYSLFQLSTCCLLILVPLSRSILYFR